MASEEFTHEEITSLKKLVCLLKSDNFHEESPAADPPHADQVPEYLSPVELAELLGCSLKTVHTRAAPRAVRPFPFQVLRSGRLLRFKRSDVVSAMEKGKL